VWTSRMLWGWILAGWGLFNLIEGILDHQILGIHHVRSGPYQAWWDAGFLFLGGMLLIGGYILRHSDRPFAPDAGDASGRASGTA
jgi:uncharacterized membrane protein